MTGLENFFNMGGHGGYIWPAYGIVAAALAGLWIASRRFVRNSAAELETLNPRSRHRQGDGDEA